MPIAQDEDEPTLSLPGPDILWPKPSGDTRVCFEQTAAR
jgi:hypothetical protein